MTTTIFDAVNEEFDQIESKRQAKLEQKLTQSIQADSDSPTTLPPSPPAPPPPPPPPPLPMSPSSLLSQKPLGQDDIPSWPAELLLEWWIDPNTYGCGPSDCLIESELLRLGGPFLHTWQKKHVRLFPNRLEIYAKTQHGIPLKVVEQWFSELLQAFSASGQVLSSMSRKVYWIYGIDEPKMYARATPSSTKDLGHTAPPPITPELAAKRKQFRRMQSFQTALTGSASRTWSPPLQRAFPAEASTGRRAILKNLSKVGFSRSQDVPDAGDCA
uniref:Uncharacterized protein n=1 Tax=Mesocestoides corti TaxID=53468 RepID=A0A5K3FW29_MESCO